jgi:hypothetical protein
MFVFTFIAEISQNRLTKTYMTMKRTLIFFALAAVAVATACKRNAPADIDYGCVWEYEIANETEFEVTYIYGGSETVIESNAKGIIFRRDTECGKNDKPTDMYIADGLMFNSAHRLILNGEFIPNTIWKRDLWSFAAEVHHATYSLTITDELIENLE